MATWLPQAIPLLTSHEPHTSTHPLPHVPMPRLPLPSSACTLVLPLIRLSPPSAATSPSNTPVHATWYILLMQVKARLLNLSGGKGRLPAGQVRRMRRGGEKFQRMVEERRRQIEAFDS